MITIHSHEINEANRQILIEAGPRDERNGNASHVYELKRTEGQLVLGEVRFQHGPIGEVGVNGVTNEALLAIVIDRLIGFQSSKYACAENAAALGYLENALEALHSRTRDREARGVEGTHTP